VLTVAVDQSRGCPVDLEYRLPEDELARSGLWKNWCTLDRDGRCTVIIGQDAEGGRVEIQRIRFCRGDWLPALGSFEIVP
jgi:hypothetical protein